jgi:putative Mg2+ transporter-C (MgtC) family protein
MHLNGNVGATQIIAYVVSGVGFLGAGVIMKQGSNVWGLNTAATLWCSAAVGACAGADLAFEAIALTGFVLAGNTLLRPLVNAINRTPLKPATTEAIYEVRVTTSADHLDEARELLREQLETANYPLQDIEVIEREQSGIELVATFRASTAIRSWKTPAGVCERRNKPRHSAKFRQSELDLTQEGLNLCLFRNQRLLHRAS